MEAVRRSKAVVKKALNEVNFIDKLIYVSLAKMIRYELKINSK